MVNSRAKGAAGEREWRDVLRSQGYEARRGQQYSGSPDSPDVVCEALPVHWEVKRVQSLNIDQAMRQATCDGFAGKIPAVAHRKNGEDWKVTVWAEDFLLLLRRAGAEKKADNYHVSKAPKKGR